MASFGNPGIYERHLILAARTVHVDKVAVLVVVPKFFKSPITLRSIPPVSLIRLAPFSLPAASSLPPRPQPAVHPPRPSVPTRSPMGRNVKTNVKTSAGSSTISLPLPSPVSPASLSMETPSLGSHELLPRPKRGAPIVQPAQPRKKKVQPAEGEETDAKPEPLSPALCEGW
ncbi:hypothetical protein C8J57DRAFT_1531954 [Mycena rebaudengoi]|nr:hypothetical protein C8J57DRAFT_1531954 [Mycena rebaudengoi]